LLQKHQVSEFSLKTSDLMLKYQMWQHCLGDQVGRRVFWEGPKFFKLCQTDFSRGAKKLLGRFTPPITGLGQSRNRESPNTLSASAHFAHVRLFACRSRL